MSAATISKKKPASKAPKNAEFAPKIFDTFVGTHGLANTLLCDYYLGERSKDPKPLTPEETKQIATNLLRDYVDTGAITLPRGCKIEDYRFSLVEPGNAWGGTLKIVSKSNGTRQVTHGAMRVIDTETKMDDTSVVYQLICGMWQALWDMHYTP
jgi:hypothetical protein